MNPDDIVQIGPLALALDRLVAACLILVFLTAIDWIVRRYSVKAWQPAAVALLAGLLGARIGHVWEHRASYALEPVAALQFWLGGWNWIAGVIATAMALTLLLRRMQPLVASLAVLAALSLVWTGFLASGEDKAALRLPPSLVLNGLPAANGKAQVWSLGELRGRPVVLNLWATWCPPCRREMPMLVTAAKSEGRATILLVNQGEQPAQVNAFLRSQGLDPGHVALDPAGLLGQFAAAKALPTTLLIASDGTVRQVHTGEITRVQLDIAIRALD